MRSVVLIPARLESSRFPAKALAPILGIPMVILCAQNASASGLPTFVCTDNDLICKTCELYDIKFVKTPPFNTGTDRVHWAADQLDFSFIINLQGDEPLISPSAIKSIADNIESADPDHLSIFNGLSSLSPNKSFDPNNVKAVINDSNKIVFLSRKSIINSTSDSPSTLFLKQLGLYAFTKKSLDYFAKMPQCRIELNENIEMMRWLNHSLPLNGLLLDTPSISVDTPEDLAEVEQYLSNSR